MCVCVCYGVVVGWGIVLVSEWKPCMVKGFDHARPTSYHSIPHPLNTPKSHSCLQYLDKRRGHLESHGVARSRRAALLGVRQHRARTAETRLCVPQHPPAQRHVCPYMPIVVESLVRSMCPPLSHCCGRCCGSTSPHPHAQHPQKFVVLQERRVGDVLKRTKPLHEAPLPRGVFAVLTLE